MRIVATLALLVATAPLAISCREPSPDRASASWTEPATGIRFVHISPGSFLMGSPPAEPRREPGEILHRIRIDQAFWLGAFEITQGQWERVMGVNPSHFQDTRGDRPVENVRWHEVQEFLRRLETLNPGERFRLPAEREWEYACRAGTTTAYGHGAELSADEANIATRIEEAIAGRGQTRPVGSYAPNAWGLYDMHGNVWEWTADDHCPYETSTCASGLKVIRGGSWYFEADSARCALRYTHRPQDRGFSLGFRVVRESAGKGAKDGSGR